MMACSVQFMKHVFPRLYSPLSPTQCRLKAPSDLNETSKEASTLALLGNDSRKLVHV